MVWSPAYEPMAMKLFIDGWFACGQVYDQLASIVLYSTPASAVMPVK